MNYRNNTLNDKKLTRIRGDVLSRGFLREILERHKPEVIIHLASLPIANVSNVHSEEATNDIFLNTITLLDVIKDMNYKPERLVYISSSMAYGDFSKDDEGKIIPASEEDLCRPTCIYGSMKLCGEILVKTYNKRFGIPYVIVRPSAVYGPTDCNQRVTEIFAMNAIEGNKLILDNGGLHQLDFTYVKDLAKGLSLAAASNDALGETFNLTRGEGRTIKELSDILIGLLPDSGCEAVVKETKVYRPNRGSLNISKARKILGYDPQYSLEDGMKEYIEFIKETLMKNK